MDVDSDSSVKTAIANIYKEAGNIDVLVNNAGLAREGSVEELPLAEFRAVMETNYFGTLRTIQALLPQMRQAPRWLHHQRLFGRRSAHRASPDSLLRVKMGARSADRRAGWRDEDIQRSRRHRRARHHRHREARRIEDPATKSVYGQ